jgi:hypothetical protein
MTLSGRSTSPEGRARRSREEQPQSVRCAACKTEVAAADLLAPGASAPFCLPCLRRRPDATFAQRLIACRLAAGLTTGQLAARAGGSENTILRYESGRRLPGQARLIALVEVLGEDLLAD